MARKSKKFKFTKKTALLLAAFLLLVVLFFVFHHSKKTTSTIPVASPVATVKSSGDKQSSNSKADSSTSANNTTPQSTSAPTSSVSSTPPANPSGSFVINHSPNLGGSPNSSKEQSTCITTPGAACYIEFAKDNDIKRLPAQTTDSSGAAVWEWDINDAGLSEGSWTVTAVASLNGQTRSTADHLTLEIKP